MPIDKSCQHCGKTFRVKPKNAAQKFCEQACRRAHESAVGRPAAKVEPIKFSCKICNTPFEMGPSYLKAYQKKHGKEPMYCSTKCGGIGRMLPKSAWKATCMQCNVTMPIQRRPGGSINRQKNYLCSTACRSMFRRVAYQQKRGERPATSRIVRNGYIRLIVPGAIGEPSRDVLEHRYVMEQKLGRLLLPDETVHHINGVRSDNVEANLELFSSRHGPGQRVIDKVDFAIEILRLYPEFARQRGVELRELSPPSIAAAPEIHLSLPS